MWMALDLYLSNDPGKLLQWLWYNDSTTKIMIAIIRPHHSTTYIDAAYCYRRSSVVCRSVTIVSPAKMVELIEMLFGMWTPVGPWNQALDGV